MTQLQSQFDASVDEALDAIDRHDGPVLVDLDETLYLRNSTEDFIDTAVPSTLAWLLLKLVDMLRPWRFTGGEITRDVWRVRLICLVFPWTLLLWRRRVTDLAKQHTNRALLSRLQARTEKPVVVTLGFGLAVLPLLRAMGLTDINVIAMSPFNANRRRRGKLSAVVADIGDSAVKRSLLVTDSMDDADILGVCARPLLVVWPEAQFIDAFSSTYIPSQYLSRVKRPGQQYLYRVIVRDDFVFWILASIGLALNPFTHVLGLALLAVSFWTIYEWGYVDNDRIGARHEKNPHLSEEFRSGGVAYSTPLAWVWASATGVLALLVLRWPVLPVLTDYLAWAAVLLTTYGSYLLYNRLNKVTRIWLYGVLQLLRIAAFVAVVPVTVVGAAALCGYTIARWIPYLNYRTVGGDWVEGSMYTIRLMMYCVIAFVMAFAVGWHILWSLTALALLVWNLFKARHELRKIAAQAYRIDRVEPARPAEQRTGAGALPR